MRRVTLLLLPLLLAATAAFAQSPLHPEGYGPNAVIVEGDIVLPDGLAMLYADSGFCGTTWPGGNVPYSFDSNINSAKRALILEAINDIERVCGVDFFESSIPVGPRITFRSSTGNNSAVGMQLFGQSVNLSLFAGKFTIIHEIMHALGFIHEQSRPDRDNYVQIQWANVDQNSTACGGSCNHNFEIRSCASVSANYDFDSVMHYEEDAFSVNGQPTIVCLPPYAQFQSTMGRHNHMSLQDAYSLAARYGMPAAPTITSVVQAPVAAGSGDHRIRVFGSRFFQGSTGGGGVIGSQVHFNGAAVKTEYVSPTEIVGIVPDELLTRAGTFPVAVFNWPHTGNWSNTVIYGVSEGARKVLITEVTWGDFEAVEICNFDVVPHSIQGWKVRWKNLASSSAADSFSPGAVSIQPGQIMVFIDPLFQFVEELPNNVIRFPLAPVSNMAGAFTVALVDDNGTIVDEVRVCEEGGTNIGNDLGGRFHGYALRTPAVGHTGAHGIERIWGLDSNGGADWTEQPNRSLGLENLGNGVRGSDVPFGSFSDAPRLVINEIDDDPDLVEIINVWNYSVNLSGFYFLASNGNGSTPVIIRPFPYVDVQPGQYVVLGESDLPPGEMPASAIYVDIGAQGYNFPMVEDEYTLALYGPEGALIDMVRTTGHNGMVVHNHPRLPSAWNDFAGAAGRNGNGGAGAIGRDPSGVDTNRGSDWRPVFQRTMGSPNIGPNVFAGLPGLGDLLDVRMNDTSPSGGVVTIVNAGPEMAGKRFNLFSSYFNHFDGRGPFFGLGFDALTNWVQLHDLPPWGATLDASGSFRFDLPPGTFGPFVADHIAVVTDPASGAILRWTKILEEDH